MIHVTRQYEFSAAHRLHSHQLSTEENQALYGKCNRPHGHGHNYLLDVSVSGELDDAVGVLLPSKSTVFWPTSLQVKSTANASQGPPPPTTMVVQVLSTQFSSVATRQTVYVPGPL